MGSSRRPQLDGIRGLAIAMVIGYHAFAFPHGGHYGVDVFFVLSGFLITSLLAEEHAIHGSIRIRAFYIRRARRLLPALFLLLGAVTVWSLATNRPRHELAIGVASAIAYCTNIIAAHDVLGVSQALRHLWSLATEEQFYLVWPVVLGLLLRRFPARGAVAAILALAVADVGYRALLIASDAHWRRIYFAPDTRFDGLLIGSALGLLWASGSTPRWLLDVRIRRLLLAGLAPLAALAILIFLIDDPFPWSVGAAGVALTTGVLLIHVLEEDGRIARVLARPLLSYTGRISYSLYLWHQPVLVAFAVPIATGTRPLRALVAVCVAIVLAAASHHLVAQRWRRPAPAVAALPEAAAA